MWQRLKLALVCALLAALTGVAVQAILLLRAATVATRALPGAVSDELRVTRVALLNQVTAARKDILTRTERQVAGLRTDVMGEVAQIRTTADRRVGDSLARLDTALSTIEEVRGDLRPILVHTASVSKQVDDAAPLWLDCEYNPDCLFNRYVDASKGVERAALNFGQMASDVRAALPGAITTWQDIGANVKATTDASTAASRSTAKMMDNLAKATKPLPSYVRIPLSIAGAVAPPVAGALEAAAATGAFAK